MDWQQLRKAAQAAATSAAKVAGAVAAQAAVVAKDIAEDLTSFKALKDYKLAGHIATAGPNNCWKIFIAVSKKGSGGAGQRRALVAPRMRCDPAPRRLLPRPARSRALPRGGRLDPGEEAAH
jgi:hypothetical protein